jgi:hypothetical protein
MFHGDHVHISGKQVMSWSEPYDLEKATRIKQITRSTMNDIILSVTAGCLRTYFNQNGIVNPYDIKTLIPVQYNSVCSYYTTENNKFSVNHRFNLFGSKGQGPFWSRNIRNNTCELTMNSIPKSMK